MYNKIIETLEYVVFNNVILLSIVPLGYLIFEMYK